MRWGTIPYFLALIAMLLWGCGQPGESGRVVEQIEMEYHFQPVHKVLAGRTVELELTLRANPALARGLVTFWYDDGSGWKQKAMERRGVDRYVVELPPLDKGERLRYYLNIRTPAGRTITIPHGAPGRSRYELTAFGEVQPVVLAVHIALVLAAFLSWIGASLVARRVMRRTGSLRRARFLSLFGLVCFGLGAVLVGMALTHAAYGTLWHGWPFGQDRTGAHSLWVVGYWALLLGIFRSPAPSKTRSGQWKVRLLEKTQCWAIIIGTVISIVLLRNPHGALF